jgi:release factor glutamine methyltransferase
MKNTIEAALKYGLTFLKDAGIEQASLDACVILCEILSVTKEYIFLNGHKKITDSCYAEYKAALQKRGGGICTAYITGHKEFRFIDLHVTNDVLVPRADTEILVDAALECIDAKKNPDIKDTGITILDLCCGSGAIALSLLHERKNIIVYACDISHNALEITKYNAKKLNLEPHIIESDLFSAFSFKFDIIVSNPPYICSSRIQTLSREVQNEPLLALDGGNDGLSIIRRIIAEAKNFLKPQGFILIEADPEQREAIINLYAQHGFKNIQVIKDLAENDRCFKAELF